MTTKPDTALGLLKEWHDAYIDNYDAELVGEDMKGGSYITDSMLDYRTERLLERHAKTNPADLEAAARQLVAETRVLLRMTDDPKDPLEGLRGQLIIIKALCDCVERRLPPGTEPRWGSKTTEQDITRGYCPGA